MNRAILSFGILLSMYAMNGTPASFAATTPKSEKIRFLEVKKEFSTLFLSQYPEAANEIFTDRAGSKKTILMIPESHVRAFGELIHQTTGHCGGFIDVTHESKELKIFRRDVPINEELPQLSQKDPVVEFSINQVDANSFATFTQNYSRQFQTRYARSEQGKNAPKWLGALWLKMARDAGRNDIVVELLPPPRGLDQPSVRISIPGTDRSAPFVVLGGHLDSINGWGNGGESAPGADDNSSGIGALTEAYRVLLKQNFHPRSTVQIIGYAAEELGLLGSREIAANYQTNKARVRGVLQLDMVAYPGNASRAVTFMTDYTSSALTRWTEQMYGLYVGTTIKEDVCGYECSDHASWTRYGYASVMPFEAAMDNMNPNIHTAKDRWEGLLDADFGAQFAKLAVGFAMELSK